VAASTVGIPPHRLPVLGDVVGMNPRAPSSHRCGWGVLVSEDAARELFAARDQLDRLAAPKSMRVSSRLVAIRRELLTCTSRVATRVDMSPEGLLAQEVAQFEVSVVETTTAARELGITRDVVTWLCRHGQLRATRAGGRWWIEPASLEDYRARRAGRIQED
jgi:Helix-turn-helix domain